MNSHHKDIAEHVYQRAIFALTEDGVDSPLFVLIKDNKPIPVLVPPGMEMDAATYTIYSMQYAKEYKADAILLVAGMWVVIGHKDKIDLNTRASQQESKEHYLNLVYMTSDGKLIESIAGKVEVDPAGTQYVKHHEWLEKVQEFEWLQPWEN